MSSSQWLRSRTSGREEKELRLSSLSIEKDGIMGDFGWLSEFVLKNVVQAVLDDDDDDDEDDDCGIVTTRVTLTRLSPGVLSVSVSVSDSNSMCGMCNSVNGPLAMMQP